MDTSLGAILLILNALLFTGQRFIIRQSHDRLALIAGFNIIAVCSGALIIPFVPSLPWDAVPYLLVSATLYSLAMLFVAKGFSYADFSIIMPLQSSIKVVLIALLASVFLGEQSSIAQWIAVAMVVLSYIIQISPYKLNQDFVSTLAFLALGAGTASGCQYIADVGGIRVSSEPVSYIAWNLMIVNLPILIYGLITRKHNLFYELAKQKQRIVISAFMDIIGYTLILIVVYKIDVFSVLPLLNLDIIFSTLIGLFIIGEKNIKQRLLASGLLLIASLLAQIG